MDEAQLLIAVDAAFAETAADLEPWPDPHGAASPADDEYSRVSDPAKWRIIGARLDAWISALIDAGLATIERDVDVEWSAEPGPIISRTDCVVPLVAGALPIVACRSDISGVTDAGVVLGVGHPAVLVTFLPNCGCDACDSGSQTELDELDRWMESIVNGRFRRLTNGLGLIVVDSSVGWSASGDVNPNRVAGIIDDPTGWDEVSGSAWTTAVT